MSTSLAVRVAWERPSHRIPFTDYACQETRYNALTRLDGAAAERLAIAAQRDITARWRFYEQLAGMQIPQGDAR